MGGTGARALREHHGQAAFNDVIGRALPGRALVLGALAALTESAMSGARLAVRARLRVAAGFCIGAAADWRDADAGAVLVGSRDAELAGVFER